MHRARAGDGRRCVRVVRVVVAGCRPIALGPRLTVAMRTCRPCGRRRMSSARRTELVSAGGRGRDAEPVRLRLHGPSASSFRCVMRIVQPDAGLGKGKLAIFVASFRHSCGGFPPVSRRFWQVSAKVGPKWRKPARLWQVPATLAGFRHGRAGVPQPRTVPPRERLTRNMRGHTFRRIRPSPSACATSAVGVGAPMWSFNASMTRSTLR